MLSHLIKIIIKNSFSALILFLIPFSVFAWNAQGHMVIAEIALQQLKPSVQERISHLMLQMNKEYPDVTTLLQASFWPDKLRAQRIEMFTHWHYIDIAISLDGSPLKNLIDTDNAAWAAKQVQLVVKNSRANPYDRARFLAFFTHIVGDLHQPLHTASLITKNRPDGDQGGNAFFVRYKNERINVHKLWDNGIGTFDSTDNAIYAVNSAKAISARYPKSFFGDKVNVLNPDEWAKEGVSNAIKFVYSTPEDKEVTSAYVEAGKQLSEQQIALAGYRLGALLNQLIID